MKIISLEIEQVRKIPLHKSRRYIDKLKAELVREHNQKIREQSNPDLISNNKTTTQKPAKRQLY